MPSPITRRSNDEELRHNHPQRWPDARNKQRPVQAFHCPLLAKECQTLVTKMEKRDDIDRMKVAKAKQNCEDALRLHEGGKHRASVIKAGEAISLAGQAVK